MKKLITLFVASLVAVPFADAQLTVSDYSVKKTYTYAETAQKPADPLTTAYILRDAAGNPSLDFVAGGVRNVYTCDASGRKTKVERYSANSLGVYELSSVTEFLYNSSNQLIKEIQYNAKNEITGYTEYSDFENGYYKNLKTIAKDGVTVNYWRGLDHTFENGKLMSTVEQNCATDGSGKRTIIDRILYTYSGDKCATAEMQYWTGDKYDNASWKDTYTYSGDKLVTIKKLSISRYGKNYQEDNFTYSDYAATFVPKNFKAVEKVGSANVVDLSWEAPQSAVTGYMVIADGAVYDVTGTSYTTGVLKNGKHQFSVVAVNGSDIKNMTSIVTLDLQDAGVKPATAFRLTNIKEKNDAGNYPVSVAWTDPTTTSAITGYKIYYSQYSSVSIPAGQNTAEVELPSWACETNGIDGIEGVPVTLWVVVEYATGVSEKSNEITVTPFDGPNSVSTSTVEAVKVYPNPVAETLYFSVPVSAKLYNTLGVLVRSAEDTSSMTVSDLAAGTYFVKTVNKEGSVTSNTVIIK